MNANFLSGLTSLPQPKQHAAWLQAKRRQLKKLLGGFGSRAEPKPRALARREEEELTITRVSYEAEAGEEIAALLLVPRGHTFPLPAVVCLHPHNDQYRLGKSEPAGLEGDPEQAFGRELCRRGYVTLCPDGPGFEERRIEEFSGPEQERFEAGRLLLQGSCLMAKLVWEVSSALDYLETRPEVDAGRIGCLGHGLGGAQAVFAASLEPRIKAAAASSGVSTYAALLRGNILQPLAFYVPGLLTWGEVPEIVSMIAPRPFLIIGGKNDPDFPADGREAVYWAAHQLYQRLGAAEALERAVFEGGEEFSPERRARAYNWFDRWL